MKQIVGYFIKYRWMVCFSSVESRHKKKTVIAHNGNTLTTNNAKQPTVGANANYQDEYR